MIRTIKFRSWDKTWKNISYSVTSIEPNENFILMQFSGLLDKNSKEIYEGDIVTMTRGSEQKYKIQWSDEWGKAGFVIKGLKRYANDKVAFSSDYLNPYYAESLEIIGDIYQNPELLEKE